MTLRINCLTGAEISEIIPALANIRIRVFKEYPYLYDGDIEYEKNYLKGYSNHSSALCVAVYNNNDLVGASTGMLLQHAATEFQAPFISAQLKIEDYFYFGESVLLGAYRGQGVGKRFFTLREDHARKLGAKISTFCAVDRPGRHPKRPANYKTLDAFWQSQGYLKHPTLKAQFTWKEMGDDQQSQHSLSYWLKNL